MPTLEQYDVVVLGSGQGGKLLAWHLGRAGKRVAVVERRWVGGSCPAVACMPSKNELWSAKVAHVVRNAARFGTMVGDFSVDMGKVRRRKRDMVEREIAFHLKAYDEAGVDLVMGEGRFVDDRTIEVALNEGGERLLHGSEVVINVGSHAAIPDLPGLKDARPLTHIEALELDTLPEHLIVLGGGYTGVELAQAFRRFGSRVTIIEPGPHLMSREDADVAAEIEGILGAEGIDVLVDAKPTRVHGRSGHALSIAVVVAGVERAVEGSHILIATGRIANTAGLGLDRTGVALDARGFVQVDEMLRTGAPGVWAIGECAGSPQFTHVSVDDYRIVRDNMAGGHRKTSDRPIPYVMYTDPPLAHVGLSENGARRSDVPVRVARLPMENVLRTEATDEKVGFMKVLVAQGDDRILGFTMIGAEAGEVMAAIEIAMLAKLPYQTLRDTVIAHLTMAEGFGPLFAGVVAAAD